MSKNVANNVANEKVQDYVKKSHITTQNEQKSEKTAQDVQKNCLSLTEQWKNGELPRGRYWVKEKGGKIAEWEIGGEGIIIETKPEIIEVLAPVPSYEEWQKYVEANESMFRVVKMLNKDNYQLEKDIDKLKELLEQASYYLIGYRNNDTLPERAFYEEEVSEFLEKIDEVLK